MQASVRRGLANADKFDYPATQSENIPETREDWRKRRERITERTSMRCKLDIGT